VTATIGLRPTPTASEGVPYRRPSSSATSMRLPRHVGVRLQVLNDGGEYVVTDSRAVAYGVGPSLDAAVADWIESAREWRVSLERRQHALSVELQDELRFLRAAGF
jgi:hypothetical protein